MSRFASILALSACFALARAPVAAVGAALDISSQVDRSEITIGDRIQYEIRVVHPKDGRVELPSVIGNLGSFEVKDYHVSEPKPADKLQIQTWHFTLSTFTVGKYTIPPQLVIYHAGHGDTNAVIYYTQPIEINVVRSSPETVKDIADIAGLADADEGPPWLAYGLGVALLLGAGGFLWSRRRRALATPANKPILPPFEEAMERLGELKKTNFVRQNRTREFAFNISEVLRRYVSRRFGVEALESTTTEFLELLPKLPLTAAQKQWLASFCESLDLVKFANSPLLESDAGEWLAHLEQFLRQTRPREETQGADAAGQAGVRKAGVAPGGAKP